MDLRIFLACLVIGAITEGLSYALKLWVYKPPWLRLANVIVVFGLVFGWVCTCLAGEPRWIQFAAGAVLGMAYEAANLYFLRWWSFTDRLPFLRGRLAIILGAGIPWGVLPIAAPALAALF